MKNVSHKKGWGMETNPDHLEPPPIPLIKQIYTGKLGLDYVKINLLRDPTSITSDLYVFRMSLFDHGDPEEFLLFIRNFQTTLAATGNIETEANLQYLRTIFQVRALSPFESRFADVKNIDKSLNVDFLLKGLAWYFFCVNALSKQKCAM